MVSVNGGGDYRKLRESYQFYNRKGGLVRIGSIPQNCCRVFKYDDIISESRLGSEFKNTT